MILVINRRLIYRIGMDEDNGGKINEGTSKILIYIYSERFYYKFPNFYEFEIRMDFFK